MAFCLSGGKRTLALRGRNQPGILSPKRRSDVRGQRDLVTLLPITLACFLQPLVTIEIRLKVLPCGLAVPKTATPRQIAHTNPAAQPLRCEPMPEENPGVRGRAPTMTGVIRVRDAQGAKQSAGPSVQRSQQLPGPQGQRPKCNHLNRDAFHDIPRHPLHTAVIQPCRPRICMSRQILDISQRNTLFQQICN